jgi:multidrug resistance protein MdtO
MAPPASEPRPLAPGRFAALLAPFPGRLEFAARLALICALTTLVVEIYQTPEPALTAYVAFFVIKPDRATSIVVSVVMLLLTTLIIGTVLLITTQVIDQPFWRVVTMAAISFCLLFAASASKLKPIAGTIALIAAYALDLLGSAHIGEVATRALLYAWLFVGIPVGVSIAVNLVLGPPPRRLAERALAHRLRLGARMLRGADPGVRRAFEECLREGAGEIPAWLKLAGAEKTSPAKDITALRQASLSTAVILSVVDVIARHPEPLLAEPLRERIAQTLDDMAAILRAGGYPVDLILEGPETETMPSAFAAAALAELRAALTGFAAPPVTEPPPPEPSAPPAGKAAGGLFLPDAFTNPAHVQYALKTTAAAMFCYVVYSLLDWPGIHTCLITCYIVSLGTTAETVEKLTLRILGCLAGAATGIAAIVFLMPTVTSIGALMAVVFLATLIAGWVAAGSPRVSYIGFQLAFAFFLSVVQGSAPAFDMTVARDRIIGILFGNLVVAVVFTLIWPVSVAERIDPAVAALLHRLAALAAAGSRPKRWALAAEAQTALGAIEQDLDLTRYEPSAIRPTQGWLDRRRKVVDVVASLQGPLLIGADQEPAIPGDVAPRLARLAEDFSGHPALAPNTSRTKRTPFGADPDHGPAASGGARAFIEAPLKKLEEVAAQPAESDAAARAGYAQA